MSRLKEFIDDPQVQGQIRHLLGAIGPMLGLLLAILSLPNVTWLMVLQAVVSNWMSIVSFLSVAVPLYLSWKAKEKKEYKHARVAVKNN